MPFFWPCYLAGQTEPLGERTAMTASSLKACSLKLHVHDIKKRSQWILVLRDKKRYSIRRNDPFIKPVCELKILNESDPVGKKSNCSVQKKFSAGKHIRKFTGTANTSPVGNSLNEMHFALTAVLKFSSSQDWDLFHFTNKNATNNSFKKEDFTMWLKVKDQILIFITPAYARCILHHFT